MNVYKNIIIFINVDRQNFILKSFRGLKMSYWSLNFWKTYWKIDISSYILKHAFKALGQNPPIKSLLIASVVKCIVKMNLSIRLFSKLYVQTNFSSVICMLCVMKNNYDNMRELNWYRYRVYLLSE